MRLETPPSSIHGDDEEPDDFNEDEMIYIGDVDEVLEAAENEHDSDSECDENDSGSDTLQNAEPPKDDSIFVFRRHSGPVFCGDIHPNGKIVVTGGQDDMAYVWNIESGEVFLEQNHEDSVVFTAFCSQGDYLATGDMGGSIKVHKCPPEELTSWKNVWNYEAGDLSFGNWHSGTRVLICGTISGDVYVWKIPSGDTKILQGYGQKSECGTLLLDGRRLAVGYVDGCVKIWDLKSATVIHFIKAEYDYAVTTIDSYHDNNLIATGGLDGKARLIKSTTGKTVGILDADSEIESISFCKNPSLPFVAIGTIKGAISIWDVARQIVRHKCSSGTKEDKSSGVTRLIWIQNHLAAACLNGTVKIYEGKSGALVQTFTGHEAEIYDISYSAVTDSLLTTSEDGSSRIFKLNLCSS